MSDTAHVIRGTLLLIVGGGMAGWLLIRALRRSEDPPALLFRWLLTIPIVWFIFKRVLPMGAAGGGAAIGGIMYGLVLGLTLAIVWRHSIAGMFAKPFTDLYDGGNREIEKRPYYSMAQAKRKRGYYTEAIAEIRNQLEKFPNDFDGQLMLAEIQAENMNDLPGAELTIHRLCAQPGHPPRTIAYALNVLADWHLKLTQDRDAARQSLERIVELFPDSEMSALASQRIAHLADTAHLLAHHDPRRFTVKPGVQGMGLMPEDLHPKAPETDLAKQTADYVKHLSEHPLDTEAREKLAVLYADHYDRLDLAVDQLDQLISHPGQPAKRVVHWLNLLADLEVRHAADYETVRGTLQRIIDRYPNSPAADMALNRLNVLKLELKGQAKGPTVKLGTYEQDIGLKRGLPHKL